MVQKKNSSTFTWPLAWLFESQKNSLKHCFYAFRWVFFCDRRAKVNCLQIVDYSYFSLVFLLCGVGNTTVATTYLNTLMFPFQTKNTEKKKRKKEIHRDKRFSRPRQATILPCHTDISSTSWTGKVALWQWCVSIHACDRRRTLQSSDCCQMFKSSSSTNLFSTSSGFYFVVVCCFVCVCARVRARVCVCIFFLSFLSSWSSLAYMLTVYGYCFPI